MKILKHITLWTLIALSSFLSAQDTLISKIDTFICIDYTPIYNFGSFHDTDVYSSYWYELNVDTAFSLIDSVMVEDNDTLILVSVPMDTMQSLLIDTIHFQFRFRPEINFVLPQEKCYDGDSLTLKDVSTIYGDYTDVSYSIVGGSSLSAIDSLIKIVVPNGDSINVSAQYQIGDCKIDFETIITLKTLFQPVADFSSNLVCFGDSTLIFNQSIFDADSSSFSMEIESLINFVSSKDTFSILLPNNADTKKVFVNIQQGTCITKDTFQIQNKLQPEAKFSYLDTCENEKLKIINSTEKYTAATEFVFHVNNIKDTFLMGEPFILNDTLPDGNYPILGIVDNGNGCLDSLQFSAKIDSVTYVSFMNLEPEYCELQDQSLLVGNVNAGSYNGQFISDNGDGTAAFVPTFPTAKVVVTYTYTNTSGCTDTFTQSVDTIRPKPNLVLSGLLNAYCEFDPASELILNQTIEANSMFMITKDGQPFADKVGLTYDFDPFFPGSYIFLNVYTDIHGCFDSLVDSTTVNPLPKVSVDSLTVIMPGDVIGIGNLAGPEPNVDYSWSNGSMSSFIDVSQPGVYVITAYNMATGCEASDTAKIEFDQTIETDLVQIQISPNPTQNSINITLNNAVQNIQMIDVFGQSVSINGSTSFNTDIDGKLSLDLSNQNSGYYYVLIPNIGNFLIVKI